jgi:Flp pilus assembly protein TadD
VWALLSSLLVNGVVAQPPASADPAVERWLERGRGLSERGREAAAAALFRRAMSRAPSDPRPLVALASLVLPDDPNDREAIEPSAAVQRDAADLAARAASVVVPGDRTDPAQRALSGAIRTLGPWATALTGDHRSAIDLAALSAGRLDDVAATNLRRLAALACRRHDLGAADRALAAAIHADPTDVDLVTDLAAVRLARGRADDALRLFFEAERRRPGDEAIARDVAGALLAAGRVSEGVARFAAIADGAPDDPRAHLDLSRALLDAGDGEGASRAARAALALAAEADPEPALVLAAARILLSDPSGARAAFAEALRRDPGNVRARAGLSGLDSTTD